FKTDLFQEACTSRQKEANYFTAKQDHFASTDILKKTHIGANAIDHTQDLAPEFAKFKRVR
uniref:Uncharacterized protein n=1 Tax=Megaselia scalaris TaxID=36166 RepID=T1GYG7_MEGSC